MDVVLECENQQSHEAAVNAGFSHVDHGLITGVLQDVVILDDAPSDAPRSLEARVDTMVREVNNAPPSIEPQSKDASLESEEAGNVNPPFGSVVADSGQRRTAHQHITPHTYVPTFKNRKYSKLQGVMNFNL